LQREPDSVSIKRLIGGAYRRTQATFEAHVLERGLQPTRSGNATSGYSYLPRGLWGRRIGRGDTLLDYGSGRGRVLLQAARFYRFGHIVGVELNESEAGVARANLSALEGRLRCPRVEIVVTDATSWPVPDDVTHVYMFNPFWGETFRAVLDRIGESLDRNPRPLTLIYANPKCADDVLATGRFERVRTNRGLRPDISWQRIEVFRSR
jgi:SAM-dependent methyltransferase